jgi:hypothetical protein
MAPVLVCPECSTKHPLGDIGDRVAFPCTGCGRQLKVPTAAKQTVPPAREPVAAEPPPRREPSPEPAARVMPVTTTPTTPPIVVTPPPDPVDAEPVRRSIPPAWVRVLLWLVAVPLAFLVVLGLARGLGMLTSNQIQDLALAEGWGRFWPVARLVPFIAFAAAVFVQGGTYGIARLRERRWAEAAKAKATGAASTNGSGAAKRPAKRPPQSSRTRA